MPLYINIKLAAVTIIVLLTAGVKKMPPAEKNKIEFIVPAQWQQNTKQGGYYVSTEFIAG